MECLEAMFAEVKALVPAGAPSVDDLEEELDDVKAIFKQTYGDVADSWNITRGEVPSMECLEDMLAEVKALVPAGAPTADDLEDELEEVKVLFKETFGDVADSWNITRGEAPSMECLEDMLAEVKALAPAGAPTADDLEEELE